MDLFAHYAVGLFLSKLTGSFWTIPFSIILDIDHILGFFYDKIKKKEEVEVPKLVNFVYRKRTWLHSFLGLIVLTIIFSYFVPPHIIIISVLSHLIIDSLDRMGIFLAPFFSNKKIKGPLPVVYYWEKPSGRQIRKGESISLIVTAIFLAAFIFL